MTRTKNRSCAGKKAYPTKRLAKAAAVAARRERFGRYVSYKCKHCGANHIGHKGRR